MGYIGKGGFRYFFFRRALRAEYFEGLQLFLFSDSFSFSVVQKVDGVSSLYGLFCLFSAFGFIFRSYFWGAAAATFSVFTVFWYIFFEVIEGRRGVPEAFCFVSFLDAFFLFILLFSREQVFFVVLLDLVTPYHPLNSKRILASLHPDRGGIRC